MARILVVDDSEGIRAILRRTLERSGYTVAEATDGRQALTMMEDEEFDLVLTDMLMPHTDGFEILSQLKKTNSNAKVIIVSGAEEFYHTSAIDLGAASTIHKPFQIDQVVDEVKAVLA